MFDILVKYKEGISREEDLKLPDEDVQSCISACYFGILWKQVSFTSRRMLFYYAPYTVQSFEVYDLDHSTSLNILE